MTQPAKHTAGPWAVDSEVMILANVPIQRIRDSNGREVMRVQSKHVHLIAAAPAMYEALKAAYRLLREWTPCGEDNQGEVEGLIETALAQAEGRRRT